MDSVLLHQQEQTSKEKSFSVNIPFLGSIFGRANKESTKEFKGAPLQFTGRLPTFVSHRIEAGIVFTKLKPLWPKFGGFQSTSSQHQTGEQPDDSQTLDGANSFDTVEDSVDQQKTSPSKLDTLLAGDSWHFANKANQIVALKHKLARFPHDVKRKAAKFGVNFIGLGTLYGSDYFDSRVKNHATSF